MDEIDENNHHVEMIDGISPNASEADKNLFNLIKTKIIERAIEQGHDYKPKVGEFRASSMGYCSRKILMYRNPKDYFTDDEMIELEVFKKVEGLPEPGAHMAGQILHELIQEILTDDLVGAEEEVSIEFNNLRLVGHYDMLMKDQNGELVVIDIKSTGARRDFLPVQAHLRQLMSYQGMLGGIRGALFYINRNNWQMTYFSQDYNKNRFSELLAKLSDLALHEKNKSLPMIDPEIFETECNAYFRCDFFDYCFPDYVDPDQDITEGENDSVNSD